MEGESVFAQMFPGMEWIPLMLLVTEGGILCAVISIGASVLFTNSRFAFGLGAFAVAIGVLSPLAFLCLTANRMFWYAYVFLASPALAGAMGLWLSRARGRTLRTARILIVGLALAGAVTAGYRLHANAVAGQQMLGLLRGSEQVEIAQFEIEHQQRRVICTDKAVCDHIAKSMRDAIEYPGAPLRLGVSYSFTFRFISGSRYGVQEACVFDGGFSASIPEANPFCEPVMTHQVAFREPIPKRLREIWVFLREPWEKVAGSVMIVEEPRPVRIEYDRRLDLEGRNAR
jgi:hypothetical protein